MIPNLELKASGECGGGEQEVEASVGRGRRAVMADEGESGLGAVGRERMRQRVRP